DYGLTMLRPWLSDPQIRQKIINGQPPVELREGVGRYLEGSAQQFWRFFRDKIPRWAAEVESGARSLDEVLHEASLEVGRWVVDKTQFRQDVTDMPMFISRGGTLGRLWFQFGNFLVHQLEFLFGPGTTIEQKAKAFAVMMALGGLAGLPLFEEIDYLIRKISDERLSPKTALLVRAGDETSPEHWWALGLYKGLPSFIGVDMSQSVGLPFWQLYQRIATQPDIETNLVAFLGRRAPGGAMLVDIFMAALDYARSPSDRSFRRLIYSLMPVGIARALQAYYANAEGVLRSPVKGRALLKDVDKTVIAALTMGFTPTKSALVSEIRKELVRAGEKAQAERSAIAEQIADLYVKGTKRILTDEERERFHELLLRFYELHGDWRPVKERIWQLIAPEARQLWKGQLSDKDILRSPTMRQLTEIMRSLVGE
ncbi:MAG: hypothetical protein N2116_06150, partial [Armatimonadetes bacterium]|nr:hypothetical protein [Armatimonadota bacterium]